MLYAPLAVWAVPNGAISFPFCYLLQSGSPDGATLHTSNEG